MPSKIKTIKLSSGHAPGRNIASFTSQDAWDKALRYRVEQVTDSIEFRPGQLLERKEVEDLCTSKEWKVTVVPIK